MRYRLDIVASSVADVVTFAGGWMFDRVTAGWDVTVLISAGEDVRPIRILGADTLDLETALAMWVQRPHPHTLAVSADVFARDSRIRTVVSEALEHGITEVTLWGESWPSELERTVDSVQHPLSAAARAFKAQALAAVPESTAAVGTTEVFRSGVRSALSVAADLIPAS
ncbi:MAG: hypothetical protein WAM92_07665 [Mycobacterium sp.]